MLPFLSTMKTAVRSNAVVVQVVDVIGLRDGLAFGRVEDREGGARVGDHGAGALKIVHADS